jgi:exonuclease SbcC
MIPVSLRLRNFMCYGEHVSPLDFTGIHLACLAGDNGHGKSAIIDAITWALWGKARGSRDDELIHLGAGEMEVDFEFLLGDNHFRVLRERKKGGARGSSTLEFQILDGGQFRSLTGNSMRQTQASITETLHMEYETFINSAFLLQGRADEFTAHPPADRKRILGEILDLSHYDWLEERAKQRGRETELRLRELGSSLAEMQRELSHRKEYEGELEHAQEALFKLSARVKAEEEILRERRAKKRELELRQEELLALTTEEQQRNLEVAQARQEIEGSEGRISSYEAVLQREETIEKGYRELRAARKTDEEMSRKLSRQARASEQRGALLRAIDEARSQLALERQSLSSTLATLEKDATQAESARARLEEVQRKLEQLASQTEQRNQLLEQERELSSQLATLRAQNEQLKVEMDLLKEKLDLLEEAEAFCPLCGSELGEGEKDKIEQTYNQEGRDKGSLYRRNAASIKEVERRAADARRDREQADAALSSLASLRGEETSLLKTLEQAQSIAELLEDTEDRLAKVDRCLEEEDYALDQRQRLEGLDQELSSIGYDPASHEEVRRALAEGAHFEKDKRELDAAREGLRAEREALFDRKGRAAALEKAVQDLSARASAVQEQVEQLKIATEDLGDLSRLVERLQIEEADARMRLGAAQQKLEHCSYLEGQIKEKARQEQQAQEEKTIYDELRLAFGKKGIQAMIIEAVIPEIEDEANRLLGRMTDGRLQVRLKSQRETLKGRAVETLDIEVADELGPRDYALFSGGEAFRINFAIRVALSKLLARRAGARLQTLIVDEGFGTQDAQGRERLVEAIDSVRGDFQFILVITHLEELKDSFPVRIDVFKTPEGSDVSVA